MHVPQHAQPFFNLTVAMIVLETLSTGVRCWSRLVATDISLWTDDWFAVAAWVFAIITHSLILTLINYGLGTPIAQVPLPSLEMFLKRLYVAEIFFDIAICLPKLSALFFYVRLFGFRKSKDTSFKIAWSILFTLVIMWMLAFTILDIAQCEPIEHYWNAAVPGKCTEGTLASSLPATISSVLIDIGILLLPMPTLYRLRMEWRKKLVVAAILITGYAVVVGSLGRMAAVIENTVNTETDQTYNAVFSFCWVSFEPGMSIIAVNLPSVLQLVKRGWKFGPSSLFSSEDFSQRRPIGVASGRSGGGSNGHAGVSFTNTSSTGGPGGEDIAMDRIIGKAAGDDV